MFFTRRPKQKHECSDCLTYTSRLKLEPGDTLVIHVTGRLGADQRARLAKSVEQFAPGHKVAVLEEGMRFSVVSAHENPPPTDPGKPSS